MVFSAYAEDMKEIVIFEDSVAMKKNELPSNVEIIDQEKIKMFAPKSTVDLLNFIRGVTVKGYDAKHMGIDMGGYGAEKGPLNNVVMVNGRKVTRPDMSGVDWSSISIDNIERVEVFHGGNSVVFGDRAVGGAINIVTKKPVKDQVKVKLEAGSYKSRHGNLTGQLAGEKWALLFSYDKKETDGYRDNSFMFSNVFDAEFTYYFNKADVSIFTKNITSKYGLPGSLTRANLSEFGRKHSKTVDDSGKDFEYVHGLGTKFILPAGELKINSDYGKRHRNYAYHSFGTSETNDYLKTTNLNPVYSLDSNHKNGKNKLTLGVDYNKYEANATTVNGFGVNTFDLERTMIGYYAFDRLSYKKYMLEGGYRYQRVDDDFISENNTEKHTENAYNILTGYDFDEAGKVFVKYDRSFRFPTTDEYREYAGGFNKEITVQRTNQISLGYSYEYKDSYMKANVYSQRTENEIFTNPTFTPYSNYNLDTKRKGVDLTFGYSDKKYLAELSYSYVDAEIREGAYEGNEIPLNSKHKVKALVGYKTSFGLGFSYALKYFSSTFAGNDVNNTLDRLNSYVVSDVKVDYEIKDVELFVKVNNVFDEKYYDYAFKTAASETYYPASGRNFMAGFSYKF